MLGQLRSAVAVLFGRGDDASNAGECDDADPGDDADDRVEGSGQAILDEVYGQPEVAREAERLERQARKLEDGHDRR